MGCPMKEESMKASPVMRITLTPIEGAASENGCMFALKVELYGDPATITQDEQMEIARAICCLMSDAATKTL